MGKIAVVVLVVLALWYISRSNASTATSTVAANLRGMAGSVHVPFRNAPGPATSSNFDKWVLSGQYNSSY
jgi:hypothetical protein